MKKILKLFILLCSISPIFVLATTTDFSLNCPNSANKGDTINCTINATTSGGIMNGIKANYNFSNNASFVSFTPSNSFSAFNNSNEGFAIGNTNGVENSVSIGTLKVKISNTATTSETIELINFDLSDTIGKSYSSKNISSVIRIKSTDNNLSNLTISGINFNFSPSITTYNLNTILDKITISATKNNNYSTISGDIGTKNLNFGTNIFKINVSSENGNIKTYTININRSDNRNSDTSLSNLTIEGVNVKFNSTTYSYKYIVENDMSSTKISATANNKLSTIKGIGDKEIIVGSNDFEITVTAQNGNTKTYLITIIRKNEKGGTEAIVDSNYLKSITIKDHKIDFDKDITSYNLTVENNIEKLDIKYELDNSSSTAKINNDKLVVGVNTITIAVTSITNRTQIYTINVLRKSNRPEVNYNLNEILNLLNTENEIYVLIDEDEENKTIHKEIIEYLKVNNKIITYEIIDKNKNVIYSFKINSNLINNINIDKDLNVFFEMNKSNDKYLKKYSNKYNLLYLNATSKLELDNIIIYKIESKSKYKNDDNLYLYRNDKINKKLILEKTNISVKDGFIILKLDNINNYVLSDNLLEDTPLFNYIAIIEGTVIILLLLIIIKTTHKKNKK